MGVTQSIYYSSILNFKLRPFKWLTQLTTCYNQIGSYWLDNSVPPFLWLVSAWYVPCHKAETISTWCLEHDMACIVTRSQAKRAPKLCITDVHLTNLKQRHCPVMLDLWTKISVDCFQHFVESVPWVIKAFLKVKGHLPLQGIPNVVATKDMFSFCHIFSKYINHDFPQSYKVEPVVTPLQLQLSDVIWAYY